MERWREEGAEDESKRLSLLLEAAMGNDLIMPDEQLSYVTCTHKELT